VIKVLFVCLGNICRSPMAEAVFKDMVAKAGLSDYITVDSAATSAWEIGNPTHAGTVNVLRRNNITFNRPARQITTHDLREFDYILVMEHSHLTDIRRMAQQPKGEVALFLSYAHQAGLVDNDEVPDPYYDGRFQHTYDLVVTGCHAFLDYLRQKYQLPIAD